jgi:hypothetical protein
MLVVHRDRPPDPGDRAARGDERARSARVPDSGDCLSAAQACGAAERDACESGRLLEPEEGDVGRDRVPEDAGRVAAPGPRVEDADPGRTADHVVVRQHLPVGAQHDAGTGRGGVLVAERRLDHDHAGRRPGRGGGGRGGECDGEREDADRGEQGATNRSHPDTQSHAAEKQLRGRRLSPSSSRAARTTSPGSAA